MILVALAHRRMLFCLCFLPKISHQCNLYPAARIITFSSYQKIILLTGILTGLDHHQSLMNLNLTKLLIITD